MRTWRLAGPIAVALVLAAVGSARGEELIVKVPGEPVAVSNDAYEFAQFTRQDLQYLAKTGQPALPWQLVKVLLPPDADLTRVSVRLEHAVLEEVQGAWEVRPMPPVTNPYSGPVWPEGRVFDAQGRDVGLYTSNALFPGDLLGQLSTGQLRQWRLADVALALFQYNPVTKKLYRLAAADLVVSFPVAVQGLKLRAIPGGPLTHPDRIGEETVERLTVNFDDIAPRYAAETESRGALAAPLAAPEESRYVILTTNAIAAQSNQLPKFIASKEQRGFTVRVVTEDSWGGGTGDVAAENIRRWLQDNYEALNIEYVLFIGNPHPEWGDLPMKRFWPRSPAQDRDSPSDFYYADLTGNWDLDGDGAYGEAPVDLGGGNMDPNDFGPGGVDVNWDVLVGRIPYYGNIADLDHILAKITAYENTPQSRAAWRQRVLLPMEPSDVYTPGYPLGEEIKRDVIVPKGWGFHRVYEQTYGLIPPPETTPTTADNVTRAWNSDEFGAVFWWTHGSPWTAVDIMDVYRTPALRDQYPGFTFQASCDNAFPEFQDNLAYSLLENGAIGTVGATRWSWYWVGQGTPFFPLPFAGTPSNSGLTFEYARRLITDELDSGHSLYEMKQALGPGIWMNFTVFNLYGDPSLGLFTAKEGGEVEAGFTLCGDRQVKLHEFAPSAGRVGSNGNLDILGGSAGPLTGDLYALHRIKNRGKLTVEGDVLTHDRLDEHGHLTMTGTLQEHAALTRCPIPALSFSVPHGVPDVTVHEHHMRELSPGAYRKVGVEKRGTIRLTAGTYDLERLELEDRATILADTSGGPITVNVQKQVTLDDGAAIAIDGAGTTRDLTINTRQHGTLKIDHRAVLRGTLNAPNAKVHFKTRSQLYGAVAARRIQVDEDVHFEPHQP